MNSVKSGSTEKKQKHCSICGVIINAGEDYYHDSKVLCENCCIKIRNPRVRKTHWQYIWSIKNEYLIQGKK